MEDEEVEPTTAAGATGLRRPFWNLAAPGGRRCPGGQREEGKDGAV